MRWALAGVSSDICPELGDGLLGVEIRYFPVLCLACSVAFVH